MGRVLRTDWDIGFSEGREFGRGSDGGQLGIEIRKKREEEEKKKQEEEELEKLGKQKEEAKGEEQEAEGAPTNGEEVKAKHELDIGTDGAAENIEKAVNDTAALENGEASKVGDQGEEASKIEDKPITEQETVALTKENGRV